MNRFIFALSVLYFYGALNLESLSYIWRLKLFRMSFRWCSLFILYSVFVFLIACDNKPRKILIYSPQSAASSPPVSASVIEYCNDEGIGVDTTSSVDYLMEDSLMNYSAIAFIGSSPDKLG